MLIKMVDCNLNSIYKRNGIITWNVGSTISIPEDRRQNKIGGCGVLYCYDCNLELTVLLDRIYTGIGPSARFLQVEGNIIARAGYIVASHELKVVKELEAPKFKDENGASLLINNLMKKYDLVSSKNDFSAYI